jgi:hypothetical protein
MSQDEQDPFSSSRSPTNFGPGPAPVLEAPLCFTEIAFLHITQADWTEFSQAPTELASSFSKPSTGVNDTSGDNQAKEPNED